jgi:hypothetical protein
MFKLFMLVITNIKNLPFSLNFYYLKSQFKFLKAIQTRINPFKKYLKMAELLLFSPVFVRMYAWNVLRSVVNCKTEKDESIFVENNWATLIYYIEKKYMNRIQSRCLIYQKLCRLILKALFEIAHPMNALTKLEFSALWILTFSLSKTKLFPTKLSLLPIHLSKLIYLQMLHCNGRLNFAESIIDTM